MCDKCECEIDDFSYRWTRPYQNYDLCMECYEKEEDNSSYSMATTNSGFNFLIEGYYPMDIDSSDESSDIDPFTIRQENISTSDSDIESINTENRDTIQDGEIITDNDMYLTDEQVLEKGIDLNLYYKACYDKKFIFRMIAFYHKFKDKIDINCVNYNVVSLVCHSNIGITK